MKLAIIEGDGIGREVIPAAVKVLDAFGLEFEFEKVPLELGYTRWEKTGTAMSSDDLETIKGCDAVLFGAVTTVPAKKEARAGATSTGQKTASQTVKLSV